MTNSKGAPKILLTPLYTISLIEFDIQLGGFIEFKENSAVQIQLTHVFLFTGLDIT